MSTSDRTLSQVRAILSKLDRSIDECREKRTQPPTPQQSPKPAPVPPAPSQQAAPSSAYGRAQPLQRPQTASPVRWGT